MTTPDSLAIATPLVMDAEGLRLRSYLCPAKVWTIGWGHTGPNVRRGQTIDRADAERFLRDDLARARDDVRAVVGVQTPNREAALISFVFNLGKGAFQNGTLDDLIRRGQWDAAATKLLAYDKARNPAIGKLEPLAGLVKRRQAEAALFRRG